MSNYSPGEHPQEIRGERFTTCRKSNGPESESATFSGNESVSPADRGLS